MWMLMILALAMALALMPRLPERTARLTVVPLILMMVGYQTIKYGLI